LGKLLACFQAQGTLITTAWTCLTKILFQVTTFSAVPPILVAIDKLPLSQQFDISSLREIGSGAAPLPDGVAESVQEKYNVQISEGSSLNNTPFRVYNE